MLYPAELQRHTFLNLLLYKKIMIVKILGILDVFIAVCFWLFGVLHIFPERFILTLGIILLIKGLVFIVGFSVASFFDIVIGLIVIIASSVTIPHVVIVIAVLILIQNCRMREMFLHPLLVICLDFHLHFWLLLV